MWDRERTAPREAIEFAAPRHQWYIITMRDPLSIAAGLLPRLMQSAMQIAIIAAAVFWALA